MKKCIIFLSLSILLAFCMAAADFRLVTYRNVWRVAESCSSADTEPTTLDVGERTFQTILAAITAASSGDDEIEFYQIPDNYNAIKVSAIGITNDGTYTVDIYAGTLGTSISKAKSLSLDCNMTYVGTLAFIIGLQSSTLAGYKMAQSVEVTQGDWVGTWESAGTVDSDRTCEVVIDLKNADIIVIVPTTCSADAKLLISGY